MTSLSSLPRILAAAVGLVLAALAGSIVSTGVGTALLLEGDDDPILIEDDDDLDPELDDDDDDADPDDDDEHGAALDGSADQPNTRLAKSIARNNPFCPSCRETLRDSQRERERGRDPSPAGPVPSQLPLELVALMLATSPEDSIAIIAHSETERSGPFRPGDEVLAKVTVERVTRSRVILNHGGQLEFLDINGRYCTEDDPCHEGMGNCESDAQCLPGLVCADSLGDVYRLPSTYAVCVPQVCADNPKQPMTEGTCTDACRCTSGMGDCDNDDQCLPNHVCPSNNGPQFGKPPKWDVCVHEHCANGVQDSDETGIDCGGSRCGDCL